MYFLCSSLNPVHIRLFGGDDPIFFKSVRHIRSIMNGAAIFSNMAGNTPQAQAMVDIEAWEEKS